MNSQLEHIKSLSQNGKKLHAIKELKEHYNIGLKHAKDLVDGLEDNSIQLEHAEKIIAQYQKSGVVEGQDGVKRNQVNKQSTLIKKPEKNYTKLVILILSVLILVYFFFLR